MGWVKLENTMPENPKVLAAGPTAAWLYVCGLAYCHRNSTNGHVPSAQVARLANVRSAETHAKRLVEVGLWSVREGGYEVHDYLVHQQSRAAIEAQREATAERVKRHRNAVTPASRNADVTPLEGEKKSKEEKQPPPIGPPPLYGADFEEWLLHHEQTTGMRPPKPGTKGRQHIHEMFAARRVEGHELEDLKRATVGAFNDEHRQQHGYYDPESVLRPTKVHKLVELGRRATPKPANQRHGKVHLEGYAHVCRRCPSEISNEQANNQSGMCDACYGAHVEALTGEVA